MRVVTPTFEYVAVCVVSVCVGKAGLVTVRIPRVRVFMPVREDSDGAEHSSGHEVLMTGAAALAALLQRY